MVSWYISLSVTLFDLEVYVMLGLISLSSVSLPPFLFSKQRSSYTYAQTDSIKYDSMRPRLLTRFWEITCKTSVLTKHIYVWVRRRKKSLGANGGSIRLVKKAYIAVRVTSGITICCYSASNESTVSNRLARHTHSHDHPKRLPTVSLSDQLAFLFGNNLKLEALQHY